MDTDPAHEPALNGGPPDVQVFDPLCVAMGLEQSGSAPTAHVHAHCAGTSLGSTSTSLAVGRSDGQLGRWSGENATNVHPAGGASTQAYPAPWHAMSSQSVSPLQSSSIPFVHCSGP
jgi:hypothetical protein